MRKRLSIYWILLLGLANCNGQLHNPTCSPGACGQQTPAPLPNSLVLRKVLPKSGTIGGGDTLTILGDGFVSGTTVSIGSTPCLSVKIISNLELTCVTASGHAGQFSVQINHPDGSTASLPNVFAYGGDDVWYSSNLVGAPSARQYHTQVWTGSKILIWGGNDGGGVTNSGGIYDPLTDTWTAMSSAGAPSARFGQAAVWTGTQMMIWGGFDGSTHVNSGGLYNPQTDTWTSVTTVGAPTPSAFGFMYWTGSKVIAWGNVNPYTSNSPTGTGGLYDPQNNSWTPMSTAGAPNAAFAFSVWTGRELLVWSGCDFTTTQINFGARYRPDTNSWTPMNLNGAPPIADSGSAVWTGKEMLVWGGEASSATINTGGAYDPIYDTWRTITLSGAPGNRWNQATVWTGKQMLIFGGGSARVPSYINTGGLYDPSQDLWTATTTLNAMMPIDWVSTPNPIWTGGQFFVWGGGQGGNANVGALYTP